MCQVCWDTTVILAPDLGGEAERSQVGGQYRLGEFKAHLGCIVVSKTTAAIKTNKI
jgi:hypothetical protein